MDHVYQSTLIPSTGTKKKSLPYSIQQQIPNQQQRFSAATSVKHKQQIKINPPSKRVIVAITLIILCIIAIILGVVLGTMEQSYCSFIESLPTADPLELQFCEQSSCTFDLTKCKLPCPFGYSSERDNECPDSCECAARSDTFEGDVQFTEDDIPGMLVRYGLSDDEFSVYTTSASGINFWDEELVGGKYLVPYTLDNAYSSSGKQRIRTGQQLISQKTCMDFVPRTTQKRYLSYSTRQRRCSSFIGRVPDQYAESGQVIKLHEGRCNRAGVVTHETNHALGFSHEQNRPDRDDYVNVAYNNIARGRQINFQKLTVLEVVEHVNTDYDLDSVMHYSGFAFAVDRRKPTIVRVDNGQPTVNQRERFTDLDALGVNRLYGCPERPQAFTTTSGSVTFPKSIVPSVAPSFAVRPPYSRPPSSGVSGESEGLGPQWSAWGIWRGCTTGMGTCWLGGIGLRERDCFRGTIAECRKMHTEEPRDVEFRECSVAPCDSSSDSWGQWGEWLPCSKTCGGGSSMRFRQPTSKAFCTLKTTQARNCNTAPCGGKPAWSKWSTFVQCSATCGETIKRVKRRLCLLVNGKEASDDACPGDGMLADECVLPVCPLLDEAGNPIGLQSEEDNAEVFRPVGVPGQIKICKQVINAVWVFGDFNGDGVTDAMCGEDGGVFEIGLFDNTAVIRDSYYESQLQNCYKGLKLSGDFNADGFDDLVCIDKSRRRLTVLPYEDNRFSLNPIHRNDFCTRFNDVAMILDVNGDGKADVLCKHSTLARLDVLLTS